MLTPTRREEFDLKLVGLEGEVEALAEVVSQSVIRSVDALKNRDLAASQKVVDFDDYIDDKQSEIEDRCIHLIATQQPVARDLRAIIALLHIAVELERMGDYSEGIGKISLLIGPEQTLKPLIDIPRMAEKATAMLRDSIDALLNRDTAKAQAVVDADDEVDDLYDQVYRELLLYMIEDPQTIQRATLPALGGPRPGTHRGPRYQHRRAGHLPGRRSRHRRPRGAPAAAPPRAPRGVHPLAILTATLRPAFRPRRRAFLFLNTLQPAGA